MTASTTWLPALPGLHRRDPEHRYWLGDLEFPVSVTGVLSVLKSDFAMERIEATRATWEPRGNSCHRALELLMLTANGAPLLAPEVQGRNMAELFGLHDGPYADWIQPLIIHERWGHVEVIASERPTCCSKRQVAGTFDVAYLDPALPPSPDRPEWATGPARVLADLKSLAGAVVKWRLAAAFADPWAELAEVPGNAAAARLANGAIEYRETHSSEWHHLMPAGEAPWPADKEVDLKISKPSTYCTAAQLGGYQALERTHGNWYDYGQTIWARPGQTTFSPLHSVAECRLAWAGAWATWRALHPHHPRPKPGIALA